MLSSAAIKKKALALGFDACGVAPAAGFPRLAYFSEWIRRGYAGEMTYLDRSVDRRSDVRQILPTAASVVTTATVYNTDRPYSVECADPKQAHVSRYAWGDDYHDVVGARLDALLTWMRDQSPEPFDARGFVDTGPVQEKAYAERSGIGWIGKNTCLIHPELGSWLFLGEIVCSLELEPDRPALDHCGTCTLCLEACPTGALVGPAVLDSRRCISYLTIEQRGAMPADLVPSIGTWVYGCDVCQEVCPFNAIPGVSSAREWQPRPIWDGTSVRSLAIRTDGELANGLRKSAMRRAKLAGLRRNIGVALANAEDDS
jgi:epoxyqueuosine reductase